jgi:preprotein translocase subunit SecE
VTTVNLPVEKTSFFGMYKPHQGRYTRFGTLGGAGIVIAFGMFWLTQVFARDAHMFGRVIPAMWMQTIAASLLFFVGGAFAWWAVNKPRFAEFLIMTESEMRKVNWPTRQQVIRFTQVVIILTLLLGVIIWLVDAGFVRFFKWIGIL